MTSEVHTHLPDVQSKSRLRVCDNELSKNGLTILEGVQDIENWSTPFRRRRV